MTVVSLSWDAERHFDTVVVWIVDIYAPRTTLHLRSMIGRNAPLRQFVDQDLDIDDAVNDNVDVLHVALPALDRNPFRIRPQIDLIVRPSPDCNKRALSRAILF